MKVDKSIEISWINQPGRLRSRMESYADGFIGSTAIAGIAAVAENRPQSTCSAEKAVSVVRDAFAEGVAYGISDVLKDAIDEICSNLPEGTVPCSIAFAAVLGDEVWVYSTGTCHAFMTNTDSAKAGLKDVLDLSGKGIRYIRLKPGQSVILVTHGLRKLMGSSVSLDYASLCGKPLSFCLSEMVRETRIKFRKKGGSAAAVRLCSGSPRVYPSRRSVLICILAAVLAVALTLLVFCRKSEERSIDDRADSSFTVETVMPLE
jgi:hypothetical protein